MKRKNKVFGVYSIFLMLLTFGCTGQKEVIITKDYVINPNWDKIDNSFDVIRMNLKDDSDSINLENVSTSDLLDKLDEDTSFSFFANVKYNGEEYAKRKVYFNRDNGFLWYKDLSGRSKRNILGELQQETWYLLGGLSNVKTLYYIYIDSLGNLHSFKVPASSWTNY